MGLTKSEIFTKEQNEIAAIAKVLGHPARIAILEHLVKSNKCICNDIVAEIGLAQPTVSQHLKELKNADLIKGNIEGNAICYCINLEKWTAAKNLLAAFMNKKLKRNFNCC